MTQTAPNNHRLRAFRVSLAIRTTDLTTGELREAWQLVQKLSTRLSCELWAKEHGWKIPPYNTEDWEIMSDAWTKSVDEV